MKENKYIQCIEKTIALTDACSVFESVSDIQFL